MASVSCGECGVDSPDVDASEGWPSCQDALEKMGWHIHEDDNLLDRCPSCSKGRSDQ